MNVSMNSFVTLVCPTLHRLIPYQDLMNLFRMGQSFNGVHHIQYNVYTTQCRVSHSRVHLRLGAINVLQWLVGGEGAPLAFRSGTVPRVQPERATVLSLLEARLRPQVALGRYALLPGATLLLAVPILPFKTWREHLGLNRFGVYNDYVQGNWHRTYGPARFPLLATNWELVRSHQTTLSAV